MIGVRQCLLLSLLGMVLGCGPAKPVPQAHASTLNAQVAGRLVQLALDCVHREFPNKVAHVMRSDADVGPPRVLTPAFYGCFDWHSAVHGHWLVLRGARLFPDAPFAEPARTALARSLTTQNLEAEVRYLAAKERVGFERPYGLAWLLVLAAELHEAGPDADFAHMRSSIAALENLAIERLASWLPKLTHPIRSGEHSQTAFAMGLAIDWAQITDRQDVMGTLRERALSFYGEDRECPLAYEPSGHDFLSPCLGEADLMRRVLAPSDYGRWLARALPTIGTRPDWLVPVVPKDRADGKLAHLDGLNLSRAFMLRGIASGLPDGDPRGPALLAASAQHAKVGLAAVTGEHYAGGHWLGTFAAYLLTERGLNHPSSPARALAQEPPVHIP